jgi:prepilin-type N-terminal cleavage/methylation domain-containing protein
MKHPLHNGFSLIELVIVIVVLSVAAIAILGQFSQAARSLMSTERVQTATQLTQAQAEQLLASRRVLGYSDASLAAGITNEALTGNYSGYTRTTTITEPVAVGCPAGATCKGVEITVSYGAATLSQLDLVLVDY